MLTHKGFARTVVALVTGAIWAMLLFWLLVVGESAASAPLSLEAGYVPAPLQRNRAGPDGRAQSRISAVSAIPGMVDAVSQARLSEYIQTLQDDPDLPGPDDQGTRYTYSPGLANAAEYIRQHFIAAGLSVEYSVRIQGQTRITTVVGTLPGLDATSDDIYIVGAHYDSISGDAYNRAPGADDNASGTAAVMEAARVLAGHQFKNTLRFITFGGEEQGLLGSAHYAQLAAARGDNILGMVNLDMVGWDSNGDRVMEVHAGTRAASIALANVWKAALARYELDLVAQTWTIGATTASDHASFWSYGFPAVLLIEDASGPGRDLNPYYHSVADTFNRLDMSYAVDFVRATVATLAELAEPAGTDLAVSKSGPDVALAGSEITYTLTYTNAGTAQATGVVLTDTFSAGLTYEGDTSGLPHTEPLPSTVVWTLGDVATDTAYAFVVTMTVGSGLPSGTLVTNTLSIESDPPDVLPDDNTAVTTTLVCVYHPEDVNGDLEVNVFDIMAVAAAWRQGAQGDVDGDGDTDIVDLQKVAAAWGIGCS